MHIMSLLNESAQCSAHRDYIIVGMWREDDHALREWVSTLRTIGIIGFWLTAWPACDGMLQVVEDPDIDLISRTIESEQFAEAVLIVVLVGELQDRLVELLAKPYDGTAH